MFRNSGTSTYAFTHFNVCSWLYLLFCWDLIYCVCMYVRTYTCVSVHIYTFVHVLDSDTCTYTSLVVPISSSVQLCGAVYLCLSSSPHAHQPSVSSSHSHSLPHTHIFIHQPSLLTLTPYTHLHSSPSLTPPTSHLNSPPHSITPPPLQCGVVSSPHHLDQQALLGLSQREEEGQEEGEAPDVDELYQWTQGLSFEEFDNSSHPTPTTHAGLFDSDAPQLSH